jgi:hypothetical protein
MPRLLDLILSSSAPPVVMQNAARGKLNVPPMARLEILVHLASHPELGAQAQTSLQSWDEQELAVICGAADTPASVAEFFFCSGADRKPVIAALLRNPSIAEALVAQFAERAASNDAAGRFWFRWEAIAAPCASGTKSKTPFAR